MFPAEWVEIHVRGAVVQFEGTRSAEARASGLGNVHCRQSEDFLRGEVQWHGGMPFEGVSFRRR